ncbi:MAG: pyridoxamine 5'-phosphate oxidase family protein [bacterium]
MDEDKARRAALELAERSEIAMVGTNGEVGSPHIKAMLKMETEGLKHVWFSTNTSSRRVRQLQRDPKGSVYFVDHQQWQGLLLVGTFEIRQDAAGRERLWRDGFEKYYPHGGKDPDYTVLRFTAQWGNFYHSLENVTFRV